MSDAELLSRLKHIPFAEREALHIEADRLLAKVLLSLGYVESIRCYQAMRPPFYCSALQQSWHRYDYGDL